MMFHRDFPIKKKIKKLGNHGTHLPMASRIRQQFYRFFPYNFVRLLVKYFIFFSSLLNLCCYFYLDRSLLFLFLVLHPPAINNTTSST